MATMLLGTPACNVFDASLYQRDASPVADSGPLPMAVSNYCDDAVEAKPSDVQRELVLAGRPDPNTNQQPDCLSSPVFVGPTADRRSYFFSFTAGGAGEKWHVHSPKPNVWFFILPACNTSQCAQNGGFETTGAEHLSFQTTQSGSYYVGINVPNDDAGLPEILLQHDNCGDGMKEHGKACDLMSIPPAAAGSCVECKRVLQSGIEAEPNDSPLDANVIRVPAGNGITVAGKVGVGQVADAGVGVDPYDFYALQAADPNDANKTVRVDLNWSDACGTAFLAAVDVGVTSTDAWFEAKDRCPSCSAGPMMQQTTGSCTKTLYIPFDSQNTNLSPHSIRVAAKPGSQINSYTLTLSLPVLGDGG